MKKYGIPYSTMMVYFLLCLGGAGFLGTHCGSDEGAQTSENMPSENMPSENMPSENILSENKPSKTKPSEGSMSIAGDDNQSQSKKQPVYFWDDPSDYLQIFYDEEGALNQKAQNLLERAQINCQWTFTGPIQGSSIQVSSDWDWETNPVEDPEFIHWMHRLPWFHRLAVAYLITKDDSYAACFHEHFLAYYTHVMAQEIPPPEEIGIETPSLYMINNGIRTKGMIRVHQLTKDSDLFDEELNAKYLELLHLQAKRLEDLLEGQKENEWFYFSNHTAMAAEGALFFGILYPEFEDAERIRNSAIEALEACMAHQVHPDGHQIEASIHYHNVALGVLARPFLLAQRNGIPFSDSYKQTLHNMLKVSEYFMTPNRYSPAISDSERRNETHILRYYSIFNERPIFSVSGDPSTGLPALEADPEKILPSMVHLPDAGYIILRNGMELDSHHLVFDYGPTGGWHGHFDLFSIELYAKGKVLIADPGRWLYNDSPEREWIISTPAHNTIFINNTNHKRIRTSEFTPEVVELALLEEEAAGAIHLKAIHYAYDEVEGAPVVQRSLTFDGVSTYTITDEIMADQAVDIGIGYTIPFMNVQETQPGTIEVEDDDGNSLFSITLERNDAADWQLQIEPSWYSPNYGIRKDCMRVEFHTHSAQAQLNYSIQVK